MEKQLKKGSIRQLQEYIKEKIKEWGFDDESLHERLLLLSEEVGELIHACRKISGMNVDQDAVGIKLDIDIEEELKKKFEVVDKRNYKRSGKNN